MTARYGNGDNGEPLTERLIMRVKDNGCFFSVSVSEREVSEFKAKWPCSGLPERSIWFQFQKSNGDLVDLSPSDIDGEALLALSQDAQAYGEKRLNLINKG